jgi:hypothetical protein
MVFSRYRSPDRRRLGDGEADHHLLMGFRFSHFSAFLDRLRALA